MSKISKLRTKAVSPKAAASNYIYEITNKITNKKYIGVRSCDIDTTDDLGHKYFSSSSDQDFMLDQKENPQDYNYEVLEEFETRELAMEKEIELHMLHDVGSNPNFYNLANATSTGFCSNTTGMVNAYNIKKETWGSWPQAKFHSNRENYICIGDNKVAAFNIKEGKSGLWPKEDFDNNRDNYKFATDGVISAYNIKECNFGSWPKEDFDNNRDNYKHILDGMVNAFNIEKNIWGSWPKEDFDKDRENYISASDGMINAYNIKEGKSGSWPKEDFDKDKSNYTMKHSNAYKLLKDPTFIPLPIHNKNYYWCFDRDTLGRVAFLKADAKIRDKNRYPSATGNIRKSVVIRKQRKLVSKLPTPIVWDATSLK